MKQPKPFLNHLKARKQAKGTERRLNMTKMILENSASFPKGVVLKDIDAEFERWVTEDLEISFNGKKLPTFKLFSNQRINEYAQTWNQLDENGNLLMNFKAITRENNPKHGDNQGNSYNIPGNRDYPMFVIPILQENGLEAYDVYSMKQPYAINLEYSVTLIANKYELLNEMNQLVNFQFKALNCYIAPNGHYMPMELEDIADESEYSINDRKYYSQTYKIKVLAYIINESDFKVTHQPSRMAVRMLDDRHFKHTKHKVEKQATVTIEEETCKCHYTYPSIASEEYINSHKYEPRKISISVAFDFCNPSVDFILDTEVIVDTIETNNVKDFTVVVNGEKENFDKEITRFYKDDEIHIEVEYERFNEDMSITIKGTDPYHIVDTDPSNESSLDDDVMEENIVIE